jgi:hypothetical protein
MVWFWGRHVANGAVDVLNNVVPLTRPFSPGGESCRGGGGRVLNLRQGSLN